MTRATSFSEREMQICTAARMIEDGKTYWVAGGGGPMYAILLGKKLYAPNAQYITEDGVVAPEPMLPFDPIMTMVAARAGYRALAWGSMNTAANHAQLGLMDYGILNTLQVDQYGNINSTVIGAYGERAGLPRGTGPWRVVTPWAVYDYNDERRLRLIAVAPWVTVEQVLEECECKPAVADQVATIDTPTDEELDMFRSQLDVAGQFSGARGVWVLWDGERYVRQGE